MNYYEVKIMFFETTHYVTTTVQAQSFEMAVSRAMDWAELEFEPHGDRSRILKMKVEFFPSVLSS